MQPKKNLGATNIRNFRARSGRGTCAHQLVPGVVAAHTYVYTHSRASALHCVYMLYIYSCASFTCSIHMQTTRSRVRCRHVTGSHE